MHSFSRIVIKYIYLTPLTALHLSCLYLLRHQRRSFKNSIPEQIKINSQNARTRHETDSDNNWLKWCFKFWSTVFSRPRKERKKSSESKIVAASLWSFNLDNQHLVKLLHHLGWFISVIVWIFFLHFPNQDNFFV